MAAAAGAGGGRLLALDSLRGLCALAVALHHFNASGLLAESLLARNAFLFVDFFFVLSGFVIARAYFVPLGSGRTDVGDFVVKRLVRLYPLHLAMLIPFLLVELLVVPLFPALRTPFAPPMDIPSLGVNLALLNAVGLTDGLTWNYPSWSIGAEFLAYLGFAGLVVTLGRQAWVAMPLVALAALATIATFSPDHIDATHDLGAVRCALGFSVGVLAWHLMDDRLRLADPLATVVEILAVVAVLGFVAGVGHGPASLLSPLLFAPVVVLFAAEAGAVSRLLRLRVLVGLGAMSYSIYMVHAFLASRVFSSSFEIGTVYLGLPLLDPVTGRFGTSALAGDVLTIVYLGAVIACAAATWRFVERPGLLLGKPLIALKDRVLGGSRSGDGDTDPRRRAPTSRIPDPGGPAT